MMQRSPVSSLRIATRILPPTPPTLSAYVLADNTTGNTLYLLNVNSNVQHDAGLALVAFSLVLQVNSTSSLTLSFNLSSTTSSGIWYVHRVLYRYISESYFEYRKSEL